MNVECEGAGTRAVNVQTATYGRNKLVIELADDSLPALQLKPRGAASGKGLAPTVSEPDVKWLASQLTCRARYYNGAAQKWSTKTKRVPMTGSPNKFQRSVNSAAAALQEYHDRNHSEPPEGQGCSDEA